MNTIETAESLIENNFHDESISAQEMMRYIKSGVAFGICEESEDLEILKKSYGHG